MVDQLLLGVVSGPLGVYMHRLHLDEVSLCLRDLHVDAVELAREVLTLLRGGGRTRLFVTCKINTASSPAVIQP